MHGLVRVVVVAADVEAEGHLRFRESGAACSSQAEGVEREEAEQSQAGHSWAEMITEPGQFLGARQGDPRLDARMPIHSWPCICRESLALGDQGGRGGQGEGEKRRTAPNTTKLGDDESETLTGNVDVMGVHDGQSRNQ